MLTTVTTTTVTTISAVALVASLELVLVITLLIFLVQKEIFTFAAKSRTRSLSKHLNRVLNVAIMPLLVSFVFVVLMKVVEIWR